MRPALGMMLAVLLGGCSLLAGNERAEAPPPPPRPPVPDPGDPVARALCQGDYEKAEELADLRLVGDPDDAQALFLAGVVRETAGHAMRARPYYDRAATGGNQQVITLRCADGLSLVGPVRRLARTRLMAVTLMLDDMDVSPRQLTRLAPLRPEPAAVPAPASPTPTPLPPVPAAIPAPTDGAPIPLIGPPVAPLPPAAEAPTPAAGAYAVQLGAFRRTTSLAAFWRSFDRRTQVPALGRYDSGPDGRGLLRVGLGPLPDRAAARRVCARLKRDRIDCVAVRLPADPRWRP